MRDLFPGWVPPDEETLARYWVTATFAVDTSVLLDLYRFSEEARSGLLEALRSFGERLWIPHQVGLEFHRNRFGVLLAQREAEGNLLSELGGIQEELEKRLSQRLQGAGRRDLAPLREAADGGFKGLREKLQEAEKAHTKGLGESIREDPIYDEVVELCGDRIGEPFESARQEEVIADARKRIENEIPPGYLDADKDEATRYGDVILWHQLCEKAKRSGKPIVLIADDQKADWIWEVHGKTLGPRPELVAEMKDRASVGFYLYTPKRLLEVWEAREGRQVEPEVLEEIETPHIGEQLVDVPSTPLWKRFRRQIDHLSEPLTSDDIERLLFSQSATTKRERFAFPMHHVRKETVLLSLYFQAESVEEVFPDIKVAVTDPEGGISWSLVPPTDSGSAMDFRQVALRYPQDFPTTFLGPGQYSVAWSILWGRRMPDATRSDWSHAGDSFVVSNGG